MAFSLAFTSLPGAGGIDRLRQLQRAYPAWMIRTQTAGGRVRYEAVARDFGTRPYALVTGDLSELADALAAASPQETSR
jgi:hypothetical protein